MKTRQKTITVYLCEECGKEMGYPAYECLGCGEVVCSEHKGTMKRYNHSVYFTGSGDGIFCEKCDKNPPESVKKLHTLYREIESLSNEYLGWHENFKKRAEKAEQDLKVLRDKIIKD